MNMGEIWKEFWKKIFIYSSLNNNMQTSVKFLEEINMKIKKFNGFDENGYLPYGTYNMTFKEFKSIFGENSAKRKEIIKEYEKFIIEIKNTGYFLNHWIDGSFVSKKEIPNDIDTLTEFNGEKVDADNANLRIDYLVYNSRLKTNGLLHSWRIYKYPQYDEEKYNAYLTVKLRILTELFGTDKDNIPKGIVHLEAIS